MHVLKKGFTLAEVLITLLIIGIIASITIPGIINNTSETEYYTALKQTYSDISNAVIMVQANNNGRVNLGTASTTSLTFMNDFCNVMSCIQQDTGANIFGTMKYRYYKSETAFTRGTSYAAILNNGNILHFVDNNTCTWYGVNSCGRIFIDINGKKGPNMWGKDFYTFHVVKDNNGYSILPSGTANDTGFSPSYCDVNIVSLGYSGSACTTQRLTDPNHMP